MSLLPGKPAEPRLLTEQEVDAALDPTEMRWSDLAPATRDLLIQQYLSPRFATLKDLCQYYGLSYFSIYHAFGRLHLHERRKHEIVIPSLASAEKKTDDLMVMTAQALMDTGAVLGLTTGQLRVLLLTHELDADTLLAIHERLTDDMQRLARVLTAESVTKQTLAGKFSAEVTATQKESRISLSDSSDPTRQGLVEALREVSVRLVQRRLTEPAEPAKIIQAEVRDGPNGKHA